MIGTNGSLGIQSELGMLEKAKTSINVMHGFVGLSGNRLVSGDRLGNIEQGRVVYETGLEGSEQAQREYDGW